MGEPESLTAAAYAARLQAELRAQPLRAVAARVEHPALAWARSGAMALSGYSDRSPLMCPVPLAAAADGVLALVAALSPETLPADLDGARLLGERAAIAGYRRAGAVACGGACRLLPVASDEWIAINLAREGDFELLPAWLEQDGIADWASLARKIRQRNDVADLIARGRELGLAIAWVDEPHASPARWYRQIVAGTQDGAHPARRGRPRVLDLSALWAGPLCTHLLQLGGAEIVKIESRTRPDGARNGPPAFFDLLNAGKRSVLLDLREARDLVWLRALVDDADIVIEASRPRALRQLGIDAESLVRSRAGLTWIALSGYGRAESQAQWIAYGDDAAVDAGLTRVMRAATGEVSFVGDAIADPIAGLHAALLAWWSWHRGGSRLLSISLGECVRHVLESTPTEDWRARCALWEAIRCAAGVEVASPHARPVRAAASSLGADTQSVLQALGHRPC
ncbi:MAG: CoA transferase [Panacagrimonas sp.]